MSPLGLGLILAFAGFVSSEDFSCNGEENYRYPVEGDCRLYYACSKGSSKPQLESCSWLFHNFDPITLKCIWCWKVDCSATPPPPPTAPPTTATTAPPSPTTSAPITTPSTAAPTSPSTAAPTSPPTRAPRSPSTAAPTAASTAAPSSAPTKSPTAAPSLATTKAAKAKHVDSLMINRIKTH